MIFTTSEESIEIPLGGKTQVLYRDITMTCNFDVLGEEEESRSLLGIRNSRDYKTVLATSTHLYNTNNQKMGKELIQDVNKQLKMVYIYIYHNNFLRGLFCPFHQIIGTMTTCFFSQIV